jgi:hypothetical protein
MSVAFDELLKRQHERKDILKRVSELGPPLITDSDAVKEHKKKVNEFQSEYLDATFLVDADIDRLRTALVMSCDGNEQMALGYFDKAVDKVPLSLRDREQIARMEQEAREKEEKEMERQHKMLVEAGKAADKLAKLSDQELKRRGEVKGQLKMVKDDGSIAEPAGPVTVTKTEPAKK